MAFENKSDARAASSGDFQPVAGESGALRHERAQRAELEARVQERTHELQRANQALRDLSSQLSLVNDRLRMAMESGKSVAWDRDVRTGRDILFGDLQGVYGIPLQTYIGNVEDFRRRVHPEDRGRVVKAVDDAMESRMPYEAEFRIVLPDGAVHWLSAKGKFYYSSAGVPERMVGMAVDITERKLMEVALRESEQRLRLAVQAGKMYAIDWDVASDVVIRSEESTHIHGLSGDSNKMTHRQVLSRVHPEDRATFNKSIGELTPENPNCQTSFRVLRPDGSVLWLERTGHAFFDSQGKMVRMIGMVADITGRKLAEIKLQEYERVVERLEEMVAVVDREYRYLIANQKFLMIRNMTREQVVGHFVYEVLDRGVFEGIVKPRMDECFRGKTVRYGLKYFFPELGERDLLVSYFPIESASGVDRIACMLQDITEREVAEEALFKVNQNRG
jgi:PAS domain S-box-containing protein